jgi:hypothetical protein
MRRGLMQPLDLRFDAERMLAGRMGFAIRWQDGQLSI